MRVKVRATRSTRTAVGAPRPDYPIRVSSFFISLVVHVLIVAGLSVVTFSVQPPPKPVYNEFIKPHRNEILYYHFPKKVPDVAPVNRVGKISTPRGSELSKLTIIATSAKPKSKQVFISVPIPKMQIQEDLPAPLLVARMDTTPVPAPKPKNFVPPPRVEPKPVQTPVLDTPAPGSTAMRSAVPLPDPKMAFSPVTAPKPRNYVPPPKVEPLPVQTPVLDTPAPASAASTSSGPLPAPKMAFSPVAAPPRKAPQGSADNVGNAKADIAVASLHPSTNANAAVPNGERTGQFSKAPTQGAPASGDANATARLTVPDLTIRQPKTEPVPPPAPSIPSHSILYAERVRGIPLSTLSVPLRPTNRMIPQNVDARFQGRNVYTLVIPMEHMAAYGGDWIMWFADRESKRGETPVVRAPVPLRKMEPVDQASPASRTGERIQFAATLGKNGKLAGITLLTQTSPSVQKAVLDDVTAWDFQAATRDGTAVDVDVVLEIPFSFPTSIARGTP